MNVVTERRGFPAAVLIRALEPLDGFALMQRRRVANGAPPHRVTADTICQGPGNLSVAMGITLAQNRTDLTGATLYLEDRGLAAIDDCLDSPYRDSGGDGARSGARSMRARARLRALTRDYADSALIARRVYPQMTQMTRTVYVSMIGRIRARAMQNFLSSLLSERIAAIAAPAPSRPAQIAYPDRGHQSSTPLVFARRSGSRGSVYAGFFLGGGASSF